MINDVYLLIKDDGGGDAFVILFACEAESYKDFFYKTLEFYMKNENFKECIDQECEDREDINAMLLDVGGEAKMSAIMSPEIIENVIDDDELLHIETWEGYMLKYDGYSFKTLEI
jgi:hypothetical protein